MIDTIRLVDLHNRTFTPALSFEGASNLRRLVDGLTGAGVEDCSFALAVARSMDGGQYMLDQSYTRRVQDAPVNTILRDAERFREILRECVTA